MDIYKILEALKGVEESADYPFAGKAVGQKPGDQVRGTEKATKKASGEHPFKGRLVGAAESIEPTEVDAEKGLWRHEGDWVKSQGKDPRGTVTHASDQAQRTTVSLADKLKARWEQTKREKGLDEGGATNNPTQNTNPVDQAQAAKQANLAQQNINKLKSAGVVLPTGVSQASQSAVKMTTQPDAIPNVQDKNISQTLGKEIEQALTKGNPTQIGQIANVLKQINQQG